MTNRITPAEVRNMAGWMDREGRRVDVEVGDDAGEPWYALGARLIELANQMEADAMEALHFMTEYQYMAERNKALEAERDTANVQRHEERLKGRVLVPVQFKPHWRSVPLEFADFMQGEGDPDWWNASIQQYWAGGVSKEKSHDALQAAIDEEAERRG